MDDSLKTESIFNIKRARIINSHAERKSKNGGILYWMSRDQRVHGENVLCCCSMNKLPSCL